MCEKYSKDLTVAGAILCDHHVTPSEFRIIW